MTTNIDKEVTINEIITENSISGFVLIWYTPTYKGIQTAIY